MTALLAALLPACLAHGALIGWAQTKHFTLDDRRFLEVAFMGAELAKRRAS